MLVLWNGGIQLEGQATAIRVTPIAIVSDRPSLPHVEPVVAIHPSHPERIAIAAMAIESPHDGRFYDSWRVVVFASEDGGSHWVRRALPPTQSGPALADPSLAWAADGTLFLTALVRHADRNLRTWLWRSLDEGVSWAVELVPAAATGSEDHPVLDVRAPENQSTITVFTTIAQQGISGSVLHPDRSAFLVTALYAPNRENNNLGAGLRLEHGRLLFSYYSMSGAMPTVLWAVRSTDDGRTWVRSRITDRHVPVGFPMLAEDRSGGPRNGRVYAVWVASEETGHVMLSHSDDGGRSWSAPIIVQHDRSPVLRARPAVHVNSHGTVMVSWTDGRADAGGRGAWCWDVYAGISSDGGDSFEEEIRLTSALTCSQTPANGQAGRRWRWGGDYAGIGSDSLGRFYVSWSDTRSGVFQVQLVRLSTGLRQGSEPEGQGRR